MQGVIKVMPTNELADSNNSGNFNDEFTNQDHHSTVLNKLPKNL